MRFKPLTEFDEEYGENIFPLIDGKEVRELFPLHQEAIEYLQEEANSFEKLSFIYDYALHCYSDKNYFKALYYAIMGINLFGVYRKLEEVIVQKSLGKIKDKAIKVEKSGYGYEIENPIEFHELFEGIQAEYFYIKELKFIDKKYTIVDYERIGSTSSFPKKGNIDKWRIYYLDVANKEALFYVDLYLYPYGKWINAKPTDVFDFIDENKDREEFKNFVKRNIATNSHSDNLYI